MNTILFILILLLICATLLLAHNFGYDKGYHDGYEDGDYDWYECGLKDSHKQISKICDEIINKKIAYNLADTDKTDHVIKKAEEKYPQNSTIIKTAFGEITLDKNHDKRIGFIQGYQQANREQTIK